QFVDGSVAARLGTQPAQNAHARMRQPEERRNEGGLFFARGTDRRKSALDAAHAIGRFVARLESECPFHHLDDGMKRRVAHVSRARTGNPPVRTLREVFLQRECKARLADARLTAEMDHLPNASNRLV